MDPFKAASISKADEGLEILVNCFLNLTLGEGPASNSSIESEDIDVTPVSASDELP